MVRLITDIDNLSEDAIMGICQAVFNYGVPSFLYERINPLPGQNKYVIAGAWSSNAHPGATFGRLQG